MTDNSNPTGRDLCDQGLTAVLAADAAVHRGHREAIDAVLDELIAAGAEFTADDLQGRLDDDTRQHAAPNLVSAVIAVAVRQGRVVQTGWCTSTRPARHRGALRKWVAAPTVPNVA